MLIAREVTKEYMSGEQKIAVLRDVSFTIQQGDFVAIVGPSGSGKTTLLGLLAGLDTPTRGSVVLDDSDLGKLSENDRARLRGEKVGFVYRSANRFFWRSIGTITCSISSDSNRRASSFSSPCVPVRLSRTLVSVACPRLHVRGSIGPKRSGSGSTIGPRSVGSAGFPKSRNGLWNSREIL